MKKSVLLGVSALVLGMAAGTAVLAGPVNSSVASLVNDSMNSVESNGNSIGNTSLAMNKTENINRSVNINGAYTSTHTDVRTEASTEQELKAETSDINFFLANNQAAGDGATGGTGGSGVGLGGLGGVGGAGGDGAGSTGALNLYTGGVVQQGAAYQNFAGIQTASYNTGLASTSQAATGVTANASISFGTNP